MLTAWLLSIGLHVLALFAMFLVVFPYSGHVNDPIPYEVGAQIVGPIDAPIGPIGPPADIPKNLVAGSMDNAVVRFQPSADMLDLSALQPAGTATGGGADLKVVGVAGGGSFAGLSSDPNVVGIGTGGGDFGELGLSMGGGAGPEFFGIGPSARGVRSIVYVVDRSGSMIDTFGYVRDEMKRSVGALRRSQKFHVILFNSGALLESPPQRLVNAIEANKRELFAFLDEVEPKGSTKPENAMARAFDLEPDLIYLLSDGVDFDADLLNKLNEWNRDRKVKIFVIGYLDRTGREILERIAREHGGEFKFVSEYDLP